MPFETIPKTETLIFAGYITQTTGQLLLGTFLDDIEEAKRRLDFMVKNMDSMAVHIVQTTGNMAIALGSRLVHKKTGKAKYYRYQRNI